MSYKEKIINDIKNSLSNHLKAALNDSIKEIMIILDDNLTFQPAVKHIMSSVPNEYKVTDLNGKEYLYYRFFSARVNYLKKEQFKDKCKGYNTERKKEKWPVHFEFNSVTKLWDVFSDDPAILTDVAGYIEKELDGELVEKDF